MKNQYVGDVGDYGKYGLLRFLSAEGIRVGVNWYLTPDDGGRDGKITGYLKRERDAVYDPQLFACLRAIVEREDKTVRMIEEADIIPKALFYGETVARRTREAWHEKGLETLRGADLVFCDPDNGPIGKKSIRAKDADKYIAPQEIADYYRQGSNVVYYCQRARRSGEAWLETRTEMQRYLPDAQILALTYHRGTQRAYLFVVHPKDFATYEGLLKKFEATKWMRDGLFRRF